MRPSSAFSSSSSSSASSLHASSLPIVVVGAGAAGLMAAIFAADGGGRPVLVLERTRDGGRKILISGGGRCNVLPSELAPARFVTDSSRNTLRNLLRSWPLDGQRAFFERTLGLPLKLEAETGKLFPASDRARDVRDALAAHARRLGVAFRFEAEVTDLIPPGADARGAATVAARPVATLAATAGTTDAVAIDVAAADAAARDAAAVAGSRGWTVRLADGAAIDASAVILATGGLSVPATGSDGTGLRLLRRLGHRLHDTYPALTPLLADPPIHASLSGVSLSVTLRAPAVNGGGPGSSPASSHGGSGGVSSSTGGFLFTHRGYSGPAVLDLSHLAVRARLASRPQPLLVQWTAHDDTAWHALLAPGAGLAVSRLRQQVPSRLADWLAADAGIAADQPLATLTRAQRHALVARLCRYPLPWTGDEGYRKAEVTGGGLALDEVDPRTLQSHRHPGLFCCGELLDAFGPIGGHNFAWAWATGRLAGRGASASGAAAV